MSLLSGHEVGGGEAGAVSEEPGAGGEGEELYLNSCSFEDVLNHQQLLGFFRVN